MTSPRTMPQNVTRFAPVGSLLKNPTAKETRSSFGRGRGHDASHLAAVRECPCLRCGLDGFSEPAHVRTNSGTFNKHNGMGAKPSDKWSLPLCPSCHRIDGDSQHEVGEAIFWDRLGLNPLLICEALHKVSPDIPKMRAVVFSFVGERR